MVGISNTETSAFKNVIMIIFICLMSGRNQVHGRCRFTEENCPSGWALWGGNCYKAIDPLPWSKARDECVSIGSVMAAPSSHKENVHLERLTGGSNNFWINCNDLKSQGTWECKDGDTDSNYRNWADGQPDNYGNERCVEILKSSALWNDAVCERWHQPSVCKQPVIKVDSWR